MTVDSSHDILVFVLSVLSGLLTGFIFDFFRALRRVFGSGERTVAIQDIIFCTLVFALFSYVVNFFNDGAVRWYEIAGMVLGIMLYFCTVSFAMMKGFKLVLEILRKALLKTGVYFRKIAVFIKDKTVHLQKALKKRVRFFQKKYQKIRD